MLILDDILDSGHTLHAVSERLAAEHPKSIKICVLLRKQKVRDKAVAADYVAFDIEDEFVVGYGLDFMERYRNLPCIGVLSEEVIQRGLTAIRQGGGRLARSREDRGAMFSRACATSRARAV